VVLFDGVSMGGPGQAPWLRRLSFALPPGSFHVLTGEAGCGKTAVLGLIGLAQRPAAGRVEMFGRETATLGRTDLARFRRRVGRVFADDRLIDHLSVFDNAALIPRLAGRPRRDHAPEVAQILAWVGLGRRMDALPASLSAGERRLDEDGARRVLRLLAELNTAGTTVVMATRDEDLAAASGAPVLRLHQGHLARVEGIDGAAGP
jgi:cell division transport system ATP-binding protein